jgi:hypothetical protein
MAAGGLSTRDRKIIVSTIAAPVILALLAYVWGVLRKSLLGRANEGWLAIAALVLIVPIGLTWVSELRSKPWWKGITRIVLACCLVPVVAFTVLASGVLSASSGSKVRGSSPGMGSSPSPRPSSPSPSSPTTTSAASPHTAHVEIPAAAEGGVATGVVLKEGERLTVRATGTATYGYDARPPSCTGIPSTDPDGNRNLKGVDCGPLLNYPTRLPSAPLGELIGKIAAGGWFPVGSEFSQVVSDGGPLTLAYNEIPGAYGDNTGHYSVEIDVASSAQSPRQP